MIPPLPWWLIEYNNSAEPLIAWIYAPFTGHYYIVIAGMMCVHHGYVKPCAVADGALGMKIAFSQYAQTRSLECPTQKWGRGDMGYDHER
jgi:hypothetical protein